MDGADVLAWLAGVEAGALSLEPAPPAALVWLLAGLHRVSVAGGAGVGGGLARSGGAGESGLWPGVA